MADEETWTEEQDTVFAEKALELYVEGHEEWEIEDLAAKEAAEAD